MKKTTNHAPVKKDRDETGNGGELHHGDCRRLCDGCSVAHLNDKVFGATVRDAQMAPFQTLRLLEAAREAGKQPGVDICCEAVELTPEQVEAMCLQAGRDKIA